ncbi:MAG: TRAP transporter small permease [Deltaproteobacteria bacterium]|nr:TRAP transporter small permease [Deltaproteobacteria bacterium]
MTDFRRVIRWLALMFNWVAVWSLVAMTALTCVDVVGRLFRHPVVGTYEIVGFLGAAVASFAMAQTTIERFHVAVEVVVTKLSPQAQKVIYLTTHMLSIFLFFVLAWESMRYGNALRTSGEVSMTLELPFFTVVYGIGFSAALVCLVLIADTLMVMQDRAKAWYRWEG